MIYLTVMILPKDIEHIYPYSVPAIRDFAIITFSQVTIFAGSNGSGKSTLLNAIAEKLNAQKTLGNQSGSFSWFVDHCTCSFSEDELNNKIFPDVCWLIKSEDIMDTIIRNRKYNEKIDKHVAVKRKSANTLLEEMGEEDGAHKRPEELSNRQRFLLSRTGAYASVHRFENQRKDEYSNGESAIQYFGQTFEPNAIYLLDEPENSLAPNLQVELMKLIEESARFFKCQFIIATHSPFLLSMDGAQIYDLDKHPVMIRDWYELENMKAYASLFFEYKSRFDNVL